MNKNTLQEAVEYLKDGKVILYPTDTIWGLGCDATNEEAVAKLLKIKKRDTSKPLLLLVNGISLINSLQFWKAAVSALTV